MLYDCSFSSSYILLETYDRIQHHDYFSNIGGWPVTSEFNILHKEYNLEWEGWIY